MTIRFSFLLWTLVQLSAYSQTLLPISAGSISNGGGGAALNAPTDVFVSGNYAYAISTNALEIIDISDPADPVHYGSLISVPGIVNLQNPTSIFISGSLAFVTNQQSNSLEIIDVSVPSSPTPISSIANGIDGAFLGSPTSVVVSGNFAFVGGTYGLGILDVSNPSAPVPKGSFPILAVQSIFVSGNYAYLATSSSFQIIDISNVEAPILKGTLANGQGGALLDHPLAIQVSGNYAFLASSASNALEVVNISNPSAPVHAGSISNGVGGALLNYPTDVQLAGNYAYVIGVNSLEVVDVSNPASPSHVGSLSASGGATFDLPVSVFLSGSTAVVAGQRSNSIEVLDVATPASPIQLARLVKGSDGADFYNPFDIFVNGGLAYVSATDGIDIIDVSNPARPKQLSFLGDGEGGALIKEGSAIYVTGNYAYVTSRAEHALEILDVSNPLAPVHKGNIVSGQGGAILGGVNDIKVSGHYAYVVTGASITSPTEALEIIDVSDPANPVHAGSIADGEGGASIARPYSVFVSGNYAYVASYMGDALEIIDISNPSAPVHAAVLRNGDGGALLRSPSSVFVSGNYAYVAGNGDGELEIVDVSNPLAPVHVSSLVFYSSAPAYGTSHAVFVSGQYCFISNFLGNYISIVDVSNPAAPVATPFDGGFFEPCAVKVSGNFAYVLSTGNGSIKTVALFAPPSVTALAASDVTSDAFTTNWNTIFYTPFPHDVSYFLDVSTDNFQTFLPGFENFQTIGPGDVITNLQPNTLYQYRVRVSNENGISTYSNIVQVKTGPPTPVATIAYPVTQTSFVARWNLVPGITNYLFDAGKLDGSFYPYFIKDYLLFTDTLLVTGLDPGTTYFYEVRTGTSWANSSESNTIGLTTIPPETTVLPATSIGQTSFQGNWMAAKGATGYLVDVSEDDFETFAIQNLHVNETSALINSGIIGGTQYNYRVRAINASGASGYSNSQSFLTIPPTPVAGPPDADATSTDFIAKWTPSKGATQYQLLVSILDFSFESYLGTTSDTAVQIVPPEPSETYKYSVSAINTTGQSGWSNEVIVPLVITGIVPTQELFQAYPNPAESTIHIILSETSTNDVNTIQVVDALGRSIRAESHNDGDGLTINVSGFASGVYIAHLESGGKVYQVRFVKK